MHGTCTQLLPDLYQITTWVGHCWHCVESRGYPSRIKTALAAVYKQQSHVLSGLLINQTHWGGRQKQKKKKRPQGHGLIVDMHDNASIIMHVGPTIFTTIFFQNIYISKSKSNLFLLKKHRMCVVVFTILPDGLS